jgi:hypothetical protein
MTAEKVKIYAADDVVEVPRGKHFTDQLHNLLVVEEEKVLVLVKHDGVVFLDEIEFIEIEGDERFEKRHRKEHVIIAKVNKTDIEFHHAKVTGLQIKEQAMKKISSIKLDFPLFKNEPGGKKEPVGDGEHVRLRRHPESCFTCVAPDDNS